MAAPFEPAAARLIHVLRRGALTDVCESAYEGGLAVVLRVGPFGAAGELFPVLTPA